MEFKQYRRTGISEMRPYIKGEDLSGISVSDVDFPEDDMGMIARNPKNHKDMWYVARKYFEDNLEEVGNGNETYEDKRIKDLEEALDKAEKFERHIKAHLKDGEEVICKICGKTAKEISTLRGEEVE